MWDLIVSVPDHCLSFYFVHMWIMGRCIIFTGIRLLLLICPCISSFFFLSSFQTLKFLVALLSGTVMPRRLEIGTHVDSRWMYRVYQNQAAAAYSSLFLFFSFSSIQTLKFSSHFSQEL